MDDIIVIPSLIDAEAPVAVEVLYCCVRVWELCCGQGIIPSKHPSQDAPRILILSGDMYMSSKYCVD